MKTYVTFGQTHVHHIDGKIFDKDCVAVIPAESPEEGRRKAFALFGPTFCFEFYDMPPNMEYFPRGFVEIDYPLKSEEDENDTNVPA